jgi:ATP phosphoribosyltransferase
LRKIKLTIPKGSLEEDTSTIFQEAFYKITGQERTYRPVISDSEIELKVLRPQEIPIYVARGVFDVGITGYDWIIETNADVVELLDLEYGKVKIVSALPRRIETEVDKFLEQIWTSGKVVRIATEYPNIASKYIASLPSYSKLFGRIKPTVVTPWWTKRGNRYATIYLSFGATEAKPPDDADLIVEVTETGITLEQNNLRIGDTILESSARLIANKSSIQDTWKREKILDLVAMLKGVVEARKRVHIFLNVKDENLHVLLEKLPALKAPTINKLAKEGWVAINTVVTKEELRSLIPIFRKLAQGLVVHEAKQVLPLDEVGDEIG